MREVGAAWGRTAGVLGRVGLLGHVTLSSGFCRSPGEDDPHAVESATGAAGLYLVRGRPRFVHRPLIS